MSALYSIYTSTPNFSDKWKGANMNLGNIPHKVFDRKAVFPNGKQKLNVIYFFHLLLKCMCPLKCRGGKYEITCNVGYSSIIDE